MNPNLAPLEHCDCRRLTVLRQDGVPTCHRCQEHKRHMAQTWVGQEPPVFKMDELIRFARECVDKGEGLTSLFSAQSILEAWRHDVDLKRAMETMRYDEWRRLHPHRTKKDLIDGPE